MQQLHFTSKSRIALSFIILAALAAASLVFVAKYNHTSAAPSVEPKVGAAVPSEFKFTGTIDWWQGATNKTSMALFHTLQDSCFVSVQHKTGTIASDQANFQKTEQQLTSEGHTITPLVAQTMTIQTNTGLRQYQLQQFSVTTSAGASQVLGGQEFGYVQLPSGYLYVEGYCDTPAELAATIHALQAIKFNSAE